LKSEYFFALAVLGVVVNSVVIFYNAWILISNDVGLEEQSYRALMMVAGSAGLSIASMGVVQAVRLKEKEVLRMILESALYSGGRYDDDD